MAERNGNPRLLTHVIDLPTFYRLLGPKTINSDVARRLQLISTDPPTPSSQQTVAEASIPDSASNVSAAPTRRGTAS